MGIIRGRFRIKKTKLSIVFIVKVAKLEIIIKPIEMIKRVLNLKYKKEKIESISRCFFSSSSVHIWMPNKYFRLHEG